MPKQTTNSECYINLIDSCNKKNLKVNYLSKDDSFNLDKYTEIYVLSPDYITDNNDETAISIKRDSLNVPEYAPTRRVRRKLVRHFLSERNTDKYCKIKRKASLRMPISESLRRFTSCPVDYPFFEVYRIKDLKKKEMITDVELDKLIEYFKEKKKLLDEAAGKSFQSNGQTYYWISRDLLP